MNIISPIAIDLGAKNTGVYLSQYSEGEYPESGEKKGILVVENKNTVTWSQAGRTSKRHARRTLSRKKLSKRLFRVILKECYGVNLTEINAEAELLNGCFNRRGFTYYTEDLDKGTLENADPYFFSQLFKGHFEISSSIYSQIIAKTNDISSLRGLSESEVYIKGIKELKKLPIYKDLIKEMDKEERKKQEDAFKNIKKGVDLFLKSEVGGHKYRTQFFKEIEVHLEENCKQLKTVLCKIQMKDLVSLVCHISNLQLRVLRKYFNDKSFIQGDIYSEERLGKYFWSYVNSWHAKEVHEKEARLKCLKSKGSDVVQFWLKTEPKLTIPPYEDQNNRNIPKCQSLLFKIYQLDKILPNWRNITKVLLKEFSFLDEQLIEKDKLKYEDYFLARVLQRYFDLSLRKYNNSPRYISRIMDKKNCSREDQIIIESLKIILNKNFLPLMQLYKIYNEESFSARYGYWSESVNSLLRSCNLNPPRKSTISHILINNIFGTSFLNDLAMKDKLIEMLKLNKIGAKTILGFCKDCSEAQKKFGIYLKQIYLDDLIRIKKGQKAENPEIQKIFKCASEMAKLLNEKVFLRNDKEWKKFDNPFSLAQLYNILLKGINGFSRTCMCCTLDNGNRSSLDTNDQSNFNRLPADATRPFDGVVDRLLDKIAYKIAKEKSCSIKELPSSASVTVPILIEQNTFSFSEELMDIKRNSSKKKELLKARDKVISNWESKPERIRLASNNICPYTGDSIGSVGDIDHIIARSVSRNNYNEVFNSEANLLYCTTKGNTEKGSKEYSLSNLNKNYLQSIFKETDIQKIEVQIKGDIDSILLNYKNFVTLSNKDQMTLKHALFIGELKQKVIRKINESNKTKVNGSQRWLAKKIIDKLKLMCPDTKFLFKVKFCDARVVHNLRASLAEKLSGISKGDVQSSYSHIIDATLVFAIAMSDPKFRDTLKSPGMTDFEEGGLEEIKKILPDKFEIIGLDRKSKLSKSVLSSVTLFKDSMYSENFVPLILDKKHNLHIGFTLKNSTKIETKKSKQWFNLIASFLEIDSSSYEVECVNIDQSEDQFKVFPISKLNSSAYLFVKQYSKIEEEEMICDILTTHKYYTKKTPVDLIITPENSKTHRTKKELDKIIIGKANLKLKTSTRFLKTKDFRISGSVTIPVATEWNRLFKYLQVNKILGEDITKVSASSLIRKFFLGNELSKTPRSKARKVFSLAIVDSPSGGFQIRRKHGYSGKDIYQIQAADSNKTSRVELLKDKLGSEILMKTYNTSNLKSISPVVIDFEKSIHMNDWINIEIKNNQSVVSYNACLNSSSRFKARLVIPTKEFKGHINDEYSVHHKELFMYLGSSVKMNKDKKLFNSDVLGAPRDGKLSVIAISRDNVCFEYTASTNTEFKKAFFDAISN